MNSGSIAVSCSKTRFESSQGCVLTCRLNTVSPFCVADTNRDLLAVLVDGEVQHLWVLLGIKLASQRGYAVN